MSPHSDTSRLRAMESTAVAWNNQISKYIISNYVNILEDSHSCYSFFFGKAPSNCTFLEPKKGTTSVTWTNLIQYSVKPV